MAFAARVPTPRPARKSPFAARLAADKERGRVVTTDKVRNRFQLGRRLGGRGIYALTIPLLPGATKPPHAPRDVAGFDVFANGGMRIFDTDGSDMSSFLGAEELMAHVYDLVEEMLDEEGVLPEQPGMRGVRLAPTSYPRLSACFETPS